MEFQFVPIATLPRLVWCARLSKVNRVIEVFHGPWVETREARFFEGAWDGDFEVGEFERSTSLIGSGGFLQEGVPVFAAPTDMYVGLTTVRVEDALFVSNSTVFALAMAGDKPDVDYPDYYFDMIHLRRWGFRKLSIDLPTDSGNRLSIHQWENFVVRPDLSLECQRKPLAPKPADFADYSALLHETMKAVFVNGADATRKRPFRPISTLSQGYDSTASAAVAAQVGCREAITFVTDEPAPGKTDDSGREIGRCLGLQVTGYPLPP